MTEEATESTATESTQSESSATESTESTESQQGETRPANYEPYQERVDLSALPEDIRNPIEARFKHLSGVMKRQTERSSREIQEWQRLAAEQAAALDEVRNSQYAVLNHLQDKTFAETETQLKSKMREALEAGDTQAYVDTQVKLNEVLLQKQNAKQQPKQERAKNPTQQQAFAGQPHQLPSGNELADSAFADSEISAEENAYAQAWISERDESGQPLRPWATGNDAKSQYALIEAVAVLNPNGPFARLPLQKKLEEIDRRLGVRKPSAAQPVLGANLTTQRKSARITLTPRQEQLALRTKFGGPQAKSNADHIEAYRKQLEQFKKGTK
jgi:hypothetical protein